MPDTSRTYIVASHTHWDREWYQPFEALRARLVRVMDSLLDLLDRDPEYRHFALDGQTVPLDDYLEIRPERRADIERLVRDGRLLIGPGYVLPDEFLIGGEAHIRNLMTGIRSAREYGGVMAIGYAPDAFGHIAHLPAILRGFGIDSVLLWRGVPRSVPTSEFRWAAPDGSEVVVLHLAHGYGPLPPLADDPEIIRMSLEKLREDIEPLATTKYVLVPNGSDHLPAHESLPAFIKRINTKLDAGSEMVHGNYAMYAELVRQELDGRLDELPLFEGEMRSSERSYVLAGVLSTRIWAKQRYAHCEDLLARYAEPLSAWRWVLNRNHEKRIASLPARPEATLSVRAEPVEAAEHSASPGDTSASTRGLLRQAWRLLLQNGPHDSVTGCSVDPVYEDVRLRFDRCEQIAESVVHESLRYIGGRAARPGEHSVLVFNPEHRPRTDFCSVQIPVDEKGRLPARLVDAEGREAAIQVIGRGGYSPRDSRERVTAAFVAPEMPGFGYRVFRVEYGDGAEIENRKSKNAEIENEFFRVTADGADGTLTVGDKRTGVVYAGLNRFVDGGERGDEYTYCPPERDLIVARPSRPASVQVVESGPARHTLEVRMTYALPAGLTPDRIARTDASVECDIVTRASLYPGVARVDIQTEVDNQAKDHRLRAHFPTGIETNRVRAEQHFGVIERPVGKPEHDDTWFETPASTYPQRAFVDVSDGTGGLMLANRGLPEYEAIRESDGTATVALTLLRCVEWLSREDLWTRPVHAGPPMHTPGAQMQGRWKFDYALIPHESGWETAFAEAHRFVRPLRALRVTGGDGSLPSSGSLVELEPKDAVLSALKLAEDGDGVVARVYNVAGSLIEGSLRVRGTDGRVAMVDMNEEEPSPAKTSGGAALLSLRPNEIVTLKFS
jgi:mannosylglycerate hydrolase